MIDWRAALRDLGLSPDAADGAAEIFIRVARAHQDRHGTDPAARAWWVPGRIEVLGKHTDYGGGRSLLCAVERGFHVVATPRDDHLVNITDASTDSGLHVALDADTTPHPGHWTDYPISVVRRIARDFPSARTGMDMVIQSSLPSASGLSSSSALVVASFLPLAAFNGLRETTAWSANIADDDALAEYLGAVENGRAFANFPVDHGVGTQGGSEDHTAILRARAGALVEYHFIPATHEATVDVPTGYEFVVAMSGVHAAKGGAARQQYNTLAREIEQLLAAWRAFSGRNDASLFAAMRSAADAGDRLDRWLGNQASGGISLRQRLGQFRVECDVLIPGAVTALRAVDLVTLRRLVGESQRLAETTLHNQVDETMFLAKRATEIGAAAASAFGAGFGGSVWALVQTENADSFRSSWLTEYAAAYPRNRSRAVFFRSAAGPAAHEVCL
jgi:galactokinase